MNAYDVATTQIKDKRRIVEKVLFAGVALCSAVQMAVQMAVPYAVAVE